MISLKSIDHKEAACWFYKKVNDLVRDRLKKKRSIFAAHKINGQSLYKYMSDHLDDFLINDLKQSFNRHNNSLSNIVKDQYVNKRNGKPSNFKKALDHVFFYGEYGRWKPYELLKKLDVQCCPYCNRNYITTVGNDDKRFLRADFDHFLCKSKYPFFRLHFYNLIPSCVFCNQKAKKDEKTYFGIHIYPYEEEYVSDSKFTYIPKNYDDLKSGYKSGIELKPIFPDSEKGERIQENIKLFRLNEQYSIHGRELHFLLQKRNIHPDGYVESIIKTFPGLFNNKAEAYEFIFGKSLDEKEFINQPLSKFTKDICEEVGVIK